MLHLFLCYKTNWWYGKLYICILVLSWKSYCFYCEWGLWLVVFFFIFYFKFLCIILFWQSSRRKWESSLLSRRHPDPLGCTCPECRLKKIGSVGVNSRGLGRVFDLRSSSWSSLTGGLCCVLESETRSLLIGTGLIRNMFLVEKNQNFTCILAFVFCLPVFYVSSSGRLGSFCDL